jgi:hypothetical protein
MNTFGMSVFSKEYIFTVLFLRPSVIGADGKYFIERPKPVFHKISFISY